MLSLRRLKARVGLGSPGPNDRKSQPNIDSNRSSLNTLPVEMINRLQQYLDPLTVTALSHTCQKLKENTTLDRTCGIFDPEDLTHELDRTPSGVEQKTHIMVTDPLGPGIYTGFNLTRRMELSKLVHLEMNTDSNMYWIRDQTKFIAPNLVTLILHLQPSESTSTFSYPDGLPNFFRDRNFPVLTKFVLTEDPMFKTEYAWTPTLLKSLLTFLNKHKNLETLKFPPLWPVDSSTRPVPVEGQGEVLKVLRTLGGHITFVNALKMIVKDLKFDGLRTLDLGEEVLDKKEAAKQHSDSTDHIISAGVRVLRVVSKEKIQNIKQYFEKFPALERLYLESVDKILIDQEFPSKGPAQYAESDFKNVTLICAFSHKNAFNRATRIPASSNHYVCLHIERGPGVGGGVQVTGQGDAQNDQQQNSQANAQGGAQGNTQDNVQDNVQNNTQPNAQEDTQPNVQDSAQSNVQDSASEPNAQPDAQPETQDNAQPNAPEPNVQPGTQPDAQPQTQDSTQPSAQDDARDPNAQPETQNNTQANTQPNAGQTTRDNTQGATQQGAPQNLGAPTGASIVATNRASMRPSSHAHALHRALNLASETYYHSLDLPNGPVSV